MTFYHKPQGKLQRIILYASYESNIETISVHFQHFWNEEHFKQLALIIKYIYEDIPLNEFVKGIFSDSNKLPT